MKKILCLCLSANIQRTINFQKIELSKVNRSINYRTDIAGKAVNSARVLTQIEPGCATVICPAGSKDFKLFKELAKKDNLKLKAIKTPGNTRQCWTLLDRQNISTTELVIGEPVIQDEKEKYEKIEKKLLFSFKKELKKTDAVLLAGSKPGCWSKDLFIQICKLSSIYNKPIMVDFWGNDLKNLLDNCSPDIIKINEEEFYGTFSSILKEDLSIEQAIDFISRKYNCTIVITRGSDSTIGVSGGKIYSVPTEKIQVVNTTACGDSFNAGFLHQFLNSNNLEEALKKGTWCASRNAEAECPGTIIKNI